MVALIFRHACFLGAIGLGLLSLSPTSARGGDKPALEFVRGAHRAAVAAIRTLSCDVHIAYSNSSMDAFGHYRRDPNHVRSTSRDANRNVDEVVSGDRLVALTSSSTAHQRTERSAEITRADIPIDCDAYSYGLLTFYGNDRFRVSLDDLFDEPHTLRTADWVEQDGQELFYIDLSHSRARLEIWLDPSVNYLTRKVKMYDAAAKSSGTHSVTRFREVRPGVFFPQTVVSQVERDGKPPPSWAATFSNIVVNKTLPADAFELTLPPGILVYDMIADKVLRTDSAGKPTLPGLDDKGRPLHLTHTQPVPAALKAEGYTHASLAEAASPTRWLLPTGLLFLVCGMFLAVLRRWRALNKSVA